MALRAAASSRALAVNAHGQPVGDSPAGSIEVGHLRYSPILQRSRDTAWHSILDSGWPRLDAAFRRSLDPADFGADGARKWLADLTAG